MIPLSWVRAAVERGKRMRGETDSTYATWGSTRTVEGASIPRRGTEDKDVIAYSPPKIPEIAQLPDSSPKNVRTVVGALGEGEGGTPRRGSDSISAITGTRYAGVDVARMGRDATVIALRIALHLKNLYEFRKSPTTVTAGRVKTLCKDHIVNIEMDGLGASVYDMLREQGVGGLRPIHPNAQTYYRDKSGELSFLNVRAAMWWNVRELLDPANGNDISLPDNDSMVADLVSPRWVMTSTGKIKLESKEDIKKRLGRSPDFGDGVCLCFWQASSGGGVVF